MPDGGGESEDALQDASAHARRFSCAVTFEVELGFERLVDRFDDLAERSQESLQRSWLLGLERRSNEGDPGSVELFLEGC